MLLRLKSKNCRSTNARVSVRDCYNKWIYLTMKPGLNPVFSESPFPGAKAPPAKKDRLPWDSTWICIANNSSLLLLCTRRLKVRFSSFKRCLMPCLYYEKCSQTCPRHKILPVGQIGGKFAQFKCQKRQVSLRYHWCVVFDHPSRYVQGRLYVLLLLLSL